MNEKLKQIVCATVILTFDYLFGQSIVLHSYKPNNGTNNCTASFQSDVDSAVFESTVTYSDDPAAKSVYFQIKKKIDQKYHHFCIVNLREDCIVINTYKDCHCQRYSEYIVKIIVSVKISDVYRGALMMGTVVKSTGNGQIRSNHAVFPDIYETTHTTGLLDINGRQVDFPNENCGEHLSGQELNVSFSCTSHVSPCVIQISANDSTQQAQGEGNVVYNRTFNTSQDVYLTVKHAACNLDGRYSYLGCFIKIAVMENLECSSDSFKDVVSVTCSSVQLYKPTGCQLIINDKKITAEISNGSFNLLNEILVGNSEKYQSKCTLNIHKSLLRLEVYEILVTYFYTSNGNDRVLEKVFTQKAYMAMKEENTPATTKAFSNMLDLKMVVWIVSGIIISVALALLIGCVKIKSSKKTWNSCVTCGTKTKEQEHDYDEMNQGYLVVDYGYYPGNNENDLNNMGQVFFHQENVISNASDTAEENIYERIDEEVALTYPSKECSNILENGNEIANSINLVTNDVTDIETDDLHIIRIAKNNDEVIGSFQFENDISSPSNNTSLSDDDVNKVNHQGREVCNNNQEIDDELNVRNSAGDKTNDQNMCWKKLL